MTRILLATALVMTACKGEEPASSDTSDTNNPNDPNPSDPNPSNPTVDTVETGTGGGAFVPGGFSVSQAAWAINDNNEARPFIGLDQTGAPVDSDVILIVTILDADAAATGQIGPTNSCNVALTTGSTLPVASWTTAAGVWWGFEMPADAVVAGENCSDFDFPPEWGIVADTVAQHSWGFGITEMLPQVETALIPQFGAQWDLVSPAIIGSGWYSSVLEGQTAFPGGFANGGYALGSEVDETFTVQVDATGNPVFIPSGDVFIDASSNIASGGYTAQGLVFLQPAEILLTPPTP